MADNKVRFVIEADDQASKQLDHVEKKVKGLGESAKFSRMEMAIAGSAIVGSLGLIAHKAVSSAIEFESAFAGVRKTIDATEEEYAQLAKGIREKALEIPVDTTELSKIAELGGQLGIAQENVIDFTDTIAKLSVTTNLTAEDSAMAFARIAEIMQRPQSEITNMGSAVVGLGNNFATTESEIVEFTNRIAGAGKIAGINAGAIFGISTAFSSVGIQAEAGGTAVQKALLIMNTAVAEGSDKVADFAKIAGISSDQFAKMWKTDASEAFTLFVEGLGKAGDEASTVLGEVIGSDVRLQRSFLSLAGAGDLLRRTIAKGSEEFVKNTALTKEAAQRFGTMRSQLQKLKNLFTDIFIDFGQAVMPIVAKAVNILSGAIDWLRKGFNSLSPEIQKAIKIFAGIATSGVALAAIFAIFKVALGGIAGAIGAIVISALPLIATVSAITAGIYLLKKAYDTNFMGIKDIVDAVFNKFLLPVFYSVQRAYLQLKAVFTSAGGGIQGAILVIKETIDQVFGKGAGAEFIRTVKEWTGLIVQAFKNVSSIVKSVILSVWEFIKPVVLGITNFIKAHWDTILAVTTAVWGTIKAVFDVTFGIIIGLLKAFLQVLGGDWQGAMQTMKETGERVWNGIVQFFRNVWEAIKGIFSISLDAIKTVIIGIFSGIFEFLKGIWQSIKDFFSWIFGGIAEENETIWAGVSATTSSIWNTTRSVLGGIWSIIAESFVSIFGGLAKTSKTIWTSIKDAGVSAWEGTKETFASIWDSTTEKLKNAYEAIKEGSWWAKVKDKATGMWQSVKEKSASLFTSIAGTTKDAWEGIKNALGGTWADTASKFSEVFNGMEAESQSIFSRIAEGFQGTWTGLKDFFTTNTEEMKTAHLDSMQVMEDGFDGFIEEMRRVQFVHAEMVMALSNGFAVLLTNTQHTVDSMKKKLQELRSVLLQIKALTAPKEGKDRRSLADVGRQFGAVDPTSKGVFQPMVAQPKTINSIAPSSNTTSNNTSTSTQTQNVNFHIQGTFDSEDKAEALIDTISRRIQLQSLTG